MKAGLTYSLIVLSLAVFSLSLLSCAPKALNDFFGIEMPPEYQSDFKIMAYDDYSGAKYTSNIKMNPSIYAYAALNMRSILIKVVNKSSVPVDYSYIKDNFKMYTAKDEYILQKSKQEDYPSKDVIEPGDEVQFKLEIPMRFWDRIGMTKPDSHEANYVEDFWQGENTVRIVKSEIKYIAINLNGKTTIILKPINRAE